MNKKKTFREILKSERPVIQLGAFDALSARLIQQAGCSSYFISGFSVVGARYGVPDVGLRAFGDISAAVRDILQACDLPVLVDADDGYGDVKNVVQTVQTYERMGASAIMLEDQTWPKRCGHMAGKNVVPAEAMEAKIRAATSERINPDTFIFARTDARAVHGLDDALRRAERYLRAGADGLFIEAPESIEELAKIGSSFDVPQIANPLEGGRTPILSPKEFSELGFSVLPYGITLVLRAAKAMQMAIEDIVSGKFALWGTGLSFDEFKDAVGFQEWTRIDEKYRP
ncbi:MAG: isocitrate lyase/PEP mutase family protein [Proteobacteria bacterium]|nr:isocitrate lyase/PEP mutase family protein [Pseudomonadota bacterium]